MANLNQFKPTGKLFGTHQMKIYEVQPLKILYRYSVICSILFQIFMSTKITSPNFGHPCRFIVIYPKWQRRSRQRTWRSKQTNALVDSQASLPPAWCAWHPRSNKSRRPSTPKRRKKERFVDVFLFFLFGGGGGGQAHEICCSTRKNKKTNCVKPQLWGPPLIG